MKNWVNKEEISRALGIALMEEFTFLTVLNIMDRISAATNEDNLLTKHDICKEFTEKFVERLNYQTKIPQSFAIYVHDTIERVLSEMEEE